MSDQIVDYLFSRIENGTKEWTMDQIIYIFNGRPPSRFFHFKIALMEHFLKGTVVL